MLNEINSPHDLFVEVEGDKWAVAHREVSELGEMVVWSGEGGDLLDMLKEYCKEAAVNVYGPESLASLGNEPNISFEGAGWKWHACKSAAAAALKEADVKPLLKVTVYVDGSFSIRKKTGGWAWVASDGRTGSGAGKCKSAAEAEMRAALLALKSFKNAEVETLRCDSAQVVGALNEGSGLGGNPTLQNLADEAKSTAAWKRGARAAWTAGHAGDPLNEAAHRLAVAARRWYEAPEVSKEVKKQVLLSIMEETQEATSQGRLVTASRM